jgi:hypothetical protein
MNVEGTFSSKISTVDSNGRIGFPTSHAEVRRGKSS